MSKTELLTPFLEGGIRYTNFFNGRLLTAEDLRTDQRANRQHNEELGQAIGEGVVKGLKVKKTPLAASPPNSALSSQVNILAGLAINRTGQVLTLQDDLDLLLIREREQQDSNNGDFNECETPTTRAGIPVGIEDGIYVLVISPASGFEGRATASSLISSENITRCGSRYVVEGVQFRLIKVDESNDLNTSERNILTPLKASLADQGTDQKAALNKLQNFFAHLFLGTREIIGPYRDFFRTPEPSPISYGLLDRMRTSSEPNIFNEDVPLAMLYWTQSGIQFVDNWAVQRRPVPGMLYQLWDIPISDRRKAETEASFFQFQDQIRQIKNDSTINLSEVSAVNYFRYLPAAGIIPLDNEAFNGFQLNVFLEGLTYRRTVNGPPQLFFIEGAQVESLLRNSLTYPAINLNNRDEFIWLYQVRENRQRISGESTSPQPYVIFSSGHMPFFGDARYDVARMDSSNFSKKNV